MTDEPALIRAILAEPADDTVRLAYADWLEENAGTVECPNCHGSGVGQSIMGKRREDACDYPTCSGSGRISDGRRERAEFIRVQCAIARNPGVSGWGEWVTRLEPIRRRERELWESSGHGRDFLQPEFHDLNLFMEEDVSWSRGFVSHVTCSWSDWLQHADAILQAQPVERVRLTTWPELEDLWPGQGYFIALDSAVLRGLGERWPRIAFELPPNRWQNYTNQYTDLTRDEMMRRLREAVNAHEFVPPQEAPT